MTNEELKLLASDETTSSILAVLEITFKIPSSVISQQGWETAGSSELGHRELNQHPCLVAVHRSVKPAFL